MSGWQPKQRRAVETRRRVYEAAVSEFARVGIDQARVEDIVAAAGVAWGTFYRYFPRKEDVLFEGAARVAQALAGHVEVELEAGLATPDIAVNVWASAMLTLPAEPPLWRATVRLLAECGGSLTAYLADQEVPPPVVAMARLIEVGQQRGELRDDRDARELAEVSVRAVLAVAEAEGPGHVHLRRLIVELLAAGLAREVTERRRPPTVARPEVLPRLGRQARK